MNRITLILKSGGDFRMEDVRLISRHIRRHWSKDKPLDIVCFWDKALDGLDFGDFRVLPMPQPDYPGWWAKINLFSPDIAHLRPFLYLDLDTVILGDLSGMFDRLDKDFVHLEDFYRKGKCASGLLYLPTKHPVINKIWQAGKEVSKKGRLDYFLEKYIDNKVFFQDLFPGIMTFKPLGKGWLKVRPDNADIICFHGKPRIPEAADQVGWVSSYFHYREVKVPKAYVINLDKRRDRLNEFNKIEFPFPVERFPGIVKKNGKDGCRESHYAILKRNKEFPLLIMEDDVQFLVSWNDIFKAMKQLPDNWDLLYLGGNLHQLVGWYSDRLFRAEGIKTSHAIMYNSTRVVDYILKHGQGKRKDLFYMTEVQKKFNCYLIHPMAATQGASYSDIQKADRDHRVLMYQNYDKWTKAYS